jgi:hypothetical protein
MKAAARTNARVSGNATSKPRLEGIKTPAAASRALAGVFHGSLKPKPAESPEGGEIISAAKELKTAEVRVKPASPGSQERWREPV